MVNVLLNGLVDLIIFSASEPTDTTKLWFDLNSNILKIYNPSESKWKEIWIDAIVYSDIEPPITNILWFDTNINKMKYYDNGKWKLFVTNTIIYSDIAPTNTDVLWYDTIENKIKYYNIATNTWTILNDNESTKIIYSPTEPTDKTTIWFNTLNEHPKIYNPNKSKWGYLSYKMGYVDFDNNNDGCWTNYINIPISTVPSESIQYKIEINGDNINVYNNDGTTTLTSGTGTLDFWNKVQTDGRDIRIFDETYNQNYFWIEEFDYTNKICILWVKLNAGQEELNIAYGNDSCYISNYMNGEQTFEFFDDFENISTTKFTYLRGNGNYGIENSMLYITGSSDGFTAFQSHVLNLPNKFIIHSKVYAYDWNEWVGFGISIENELGTGNQGNDIIINGYEFGWWGWGGNQHSMKTYKNTNTIVDDHNAYNGFYSATNGYYYLIGGKYDGNTLYHFKPINLTNNSNYIIEYDHIRDDITFSNQIWKRIFIGVWNGAKWGYDYIFIRNYISADISFETPTIKEF